MDSVRCPAEDGILSRVVIKRSFDNRRILSAGPRSSFQVEGSQRVELGAL